ncbi:MAG: circularly permuted type 2 ATP-grasp protein [Alphaproteobacteria bacterium]|nr:circularly permuted type 2 ATP-grasp protein [Alphaproteobacteria bacterium]
MSTAYDEMATGQGALRPHWRNIMATVWGMPPAQLAEKQARAGAHLAHADEFVAIYGREPKRAPWSIDLLPLILPEDEWRVIAEGLAQRARLLDLVLADLYGEQRLIADRLVPPYLVYANPAFLRPMRHVGQAGGAGHLQVYAADLVRMPDGGWRVFADRTQAPSGVGYALRNRRLLARTFPEAFRVYPMRRLQPFLDVWQASLQRLGMHHGDDSRAVLLTPGPYNDAYFEHVYLARELSITLAQGSDLTVRDNVVYLKTLEGLLRVDVIYRRVDGEYCDPLELREDSALGVAGLVDAARAGKVAILNLPGSALVETPAIAPFLPSLARRLLGEELKLPAVTTWWCGQKAAIDAVRASLGSYVIRPTFDPGQKPVDPAGLSRDEQAGLLARLTADPEAFVALERVVHGVAPNLGKDGLSPRPIVLRVVALWNGSEWSVMPGGVARVVEADDMYRSRLLHGGVAKDVWVLTTEEQDVRTPSAPMTPARAHRSAGALQSRVADDLFWLGRYVERLDAAARVFRAVMNRLTGGGLGPRDMAELARLAGAMQRNGWISATIAGSPVDGRNFAGGIAKAATAPEGVVQDCLDAIRRLTFTVRDRLSLDMWRTLNHLLDEVRGQLVAADGDMDRLLDALDDLIRGIAAFAGLAAENMTRGAGWRFLDIGRRIERGMAIANTLAPVLRGPAAQLEIGLRLALELCDSTITYRTRYPTELHPARALDLVVADASNPRALMFQIVRLRDFIETLAPSPGFEAARTLVRELIRTVMDFSVESVEKVQDAMPVGPVVEMLDRIAGDLTALSEMITHTYFSHVVTAHPLGFAPRPARETLPA